MSIDEIIKYGMMVFCAGSVYGLIRADLKSLHEKIQAVNDKIRDKDEDMHRVENIATKAHERMDAHVTAYHRGVQ